ncbi:MAG: hypothetical protein UW07_C0016G0009 [Candidatus Nomurabacteria bacterium GW2011_GWF2_43_8]|uniref:Uncharacterized protein n=3 Tax=Candidatus Nomuraibacteriota TaxID=1752729 RepID=A0A0G1HXL9_9BACT|nr:MAG: hypothetical protein UV76_C0022G0014 [Candidatus Nomurabacteria bacterium GW2011_GWA2_43_15]KKT18991.1 MAG: hypothetical protein UW02_C0017G0005 [Candidatus Nomurabacteria bacterium GW2011_GWB1_43_7]KKT24387.1 MAG: hypothetical protein UW07_C0016G0009 [Candidatus Nomurabacteria bacterium GW2011_GWF2_43_8]
MNLRSAKLFLGLFILLAYIGIGIFGLFQFGHMSEAPMANCPYAENGFSVCANGLDHINDWRQFSNATFTSLFIFSLLILGIILYFFNQHNLLNQKQHFYKWKYYLDNTKSYTLSQEIIKWLSLFENSPSFLSKT